MPGRHSSKALNLKQNLATTPTNSGFGGATDSHTSLATAEEDNFFGKSSSVEPSADRVSHPFVKSALGAFEGYTLLASGYTGIWAEENTRTALYDAMQRRETYGTTGPRMTVRFFGGWGYEQGDVLKNDPAEVGYAKGVPMGGDLKKSAAGKEPPTFMVYATARSPECQPRSDSNREGVDG